MSSSNSDSNFASGTIWTGDNLPILRGMNAACVDLIYLDPPFNSNRTYEAPIGSKAAGAAFKDAWTLDDVDVYEHGELAARNPAVYAVIDAAHQAHGKSMQSYLIFMAVRLIEMRRVLKDTGSIYLHCDPTAGHYLKLLMDGIFGDGNFLNEIIWHYGKYTNAANHFQKNHDTVLVYCKKKGIHLFNKQFKEGAESTQIDYERGYRRHKPGGVPQLLVYDKNKAAEAIREAELDGRKIVYRKGKTKVALSDVWKLPIIGSTSKERTGYPTQKPLALLERVIKASSNPGDMVLDPFCGCATTLVAADRLQREWAGIDLSPLAIKLVNERIAHDRTEKKDLPMVGGGLLKAIALDEPPKRTDLGELPNYRTHRHRLYGEQEGFCAGCKIHFPFKVMEVDHILPESKGGSAHPDNLQLLCSHCNRSKGDKTMAEWTAGKAAQ